MVFMGRPIIFGLTVNVILRKYLICNKHMGSNGGSTRSHALAQQLEELKK